MELLKPFAVNGKREDFSVDTDPDGKVSLEKGFTQLYELKPTEGGLFILRKIFNQMMYLVTNDAVKWKTQTFGDWNENITYPKNAIVKYTDGNAYVSKVDNNTSLPTDTDNWVNFEDFVTININTLPDKTTPVDTDNFAIQETGGLLKKLSWANLKATLFDGAVSLTGYGYIKFPTVMNGFVIQWGSEVATNGAYSVDIVFPIAFPNQEFFPIVSGGDINSSQGVTVVGSSLTKNGFTAQWFGSVGLKRVNWICFGY